MTPKELTAKTIKDIEKKKAMTEKGKKQAIDHRIDDLNRIKRRGKWMKLTPIRLRRLNAGITSEEAIKKLKISKSSFYKLESGWQNPSVQLIKRLADTYKCTTDEIFKDLSITGEEDAK
jgi:DNA-binding XRE family transcriptional regulator